MYIIIITNLVLISSFCILPFLLFLHRLLARLRLIVSEVKTSARLRAWLVRSHVEISSHLLQDTQVLLVIIINHSRASWRVDNYRTSDDAEHSHAAYNCYVCIQLGLETLIYS